MVKQPHAGPRALAACRGQRRQAGRQAAQADASNSRGEHAGKGRHEDGHELQLHPVRTAPHGARTVFKGHGVHQPLLLHLGHSLLHPERSPGAQSPPHGIAKCQSVREKPSPQDPSGKSPVADGVCRLNTTEDRLSLLLPRSPGSELRVGGIRPRSLRPGIRSPSFLFRWLLTATGSTCPRPGNQACPGHSSVHGDLCGTSSVPRPPYS